MDDRVQEGAARPDQQSRAASSRSREARRRVIGFAAILLLSAVGFCILTVWQRDGRMRLAALDWAEEASGWLTAYVAERNHLPPVLPEELAERASGFEIPYPPPEDVVKLGKLPGPFVLIAGGRKGLITPGGDGCAAVIFDEGRFTVVWLHGGDVEAETAKRDALLGR